MQVRTATALACSNIAFVKYWGNRNDRLNIPANGSISMNLDGLYTRTQVVFDPALTEDQLVLNGEPVNGSGLQRVSVILERVRRLSNQVIFARVDSTNNFPTAVGIASSASAFAALSLAASAALGLRLSERDLSRLARLSSGSACRSIPGGFVEWQAGHDDHDSYAFSIASAEHWDLADCIAIVSLQQKATSSSEGHTLANTSPLQAARIADTPLRLTLCRRAIHERDFETLASVTELDCQLMHTVMMTSTPPLLYWMSATQEITRAVQSWRRGGIPVCYTVDAGPNVHVICPVSHASNVMAMLVQIPGVLKVLVAHPGGPARLES
jgi:diphosphomevalonate decarboxylase